MSNRRLDRLMARSRKTRRVPAVRLSREQSIARSRVLQRYEDGTYTTTASPCVCGTSNDRTICPRDRYGLPSPSVMCMSCGIVRTDPRLDDASLRLFYESDYRPLYVGHAQVEEGFFDSQIRKGELIRRFVDAPMRGWRVADIGCGAGGVLMPFRDSGAQVVGCDVGMAYLARGRAERLDLRHGDVESVRDEGPFDLMILSHVVEHVPEPVAFLRQVLSMLSSHGKVYVELPGIQTIKRYGDPLRYFQNAHLFNFDLTTLSEVMAAAGLKLDRGDEFIRGVFTPAVGPRAMNPDPLTAEQNLRAIAKAAQYWRLRSVMMVTVSKLYGLLPARARRLLRRAAAR